MSTTHKHTPGPWTVETYKDGSIFVLADYCETSGKLVADLGQSPMMAENARLIAAAPEMLEALCELIEQLEGIGIPDWSGAEGLCLKQARTAIAKATG